MGSRASREDPTDRKRSGSCEESGPFMSFNASTYFEGFDLRVRVRCSLAQGRYEVRLVLGATEDYEAGASEYIDPALSPFERLTFGESARVFTKKVEGRTLAFAESAATCRDTLAAGTRVVGAHYSLNASVNPPHPLHQALRLRL